MSVLGPRIKELGAETEDWACRAWRQEGDILEPFGICDISLSMKSVVV